MQNAYLELKLAHELFKKAPDTLSDEELARLGQIAGRQARLEQRILASAEAAQVIVPEPTISTRPGGSCSGFGGSWRPPDVIVAIVTTLRCQ